MLHATSRLLLLAALVIALAPATLAAELPDDVRSQVDAKIEALGLIAAGQAVRVILQFRRRWWEKAPGAGRSADPVSFIHLPGAPIPVWWTQAPAETPLLVGWAGGPAAVRLSGLRAAEVFETALATLAAAFAFDRDDLRTLLVDGWTHDWSADRWARGRVREALAEGVA